MKKFDSLLIIINRLHKSYKDNNNLFEYMSSIQKTLALEDSIDKEISQYRESLNTSYEQQKQTMRKSMQDEITKLEEEYEQNLQKEINKINKECEKIVNKAYSKASSIHFNIDHDTILNALKEEIKK